MKTSDFDYHLPEELIAQRPLEQRNESRMMIVRRDEGTIEHARFADFPDLVEKDDLLVMNDTRVVPARFFSNDETREILRVDIVGPRRWKCLVRPGKRFKVGRTVDIGTSIGTVIEICEEGGERIIEFDVEPDEDVHGHLALPPYIARPDDSTDTERYQTVFAKKAGAIAAPTAGLHFSDEMLSTLPHSFVTLHVGIGTFRPVSEEDMTKHHMHSEHYELEASTVKAIGAAKRTIAIGTTVVRVLESCAGGSGESVLVAGKGETDIFIYPPYQFKVVDALLTNFHLPKSTLLMLVAALAGKNLMMEAYAKAVEERYRFFSYGDCMVII
ncbi:MAG: tRNA preQ1(34) S-adenosylmethionine ribosyltransferase-isomerase QueA [Verrucomicrobiales bacterium]|nr:tRNA preQ1(34) S-adenosylmethionine ribosyltransferase-isomerase QueA [Verrucomicrobiales bacterium]